MFRILLTLTVIIFTSGCKEQDPYPPQCVKQVFDEEKYKDADYPVVRDAIRQIDLADYECFERTALEMIKTPEKQALYEPAIMGYNEILWGINGYNKYLERAGGDRTANIIYIPSRLRIQMQVDEFLRGKMSVVDSEKIPQACRQYATARERNQCYDRLLAEYTEKYIMDKHLPGYDNPSNYKPEYKQTVDTGTSAIRALYEAISNDQNKVEQQLEAYYLELFYAYFEILSMYQRYCTDPDC